jgi:hypothetical protein
MTAVAKLESIDSEKDDLYAMRGTPPFARRAVWCSFMLTGVKQ